MTFVVDASVVLRWFAPQEPGNAEARQWFARFIADADLFVAPDVLRFEVLGGLARLQVTYEEGWAERSFSRFERLGLRLLTTDMEIAERALQLSRELKVGGYDAVYLAHAESLGMSWLTADRRVVRRLAGDPRIEPLLENG